jgi:hypothetical protein
MAANGTFAPPLSAPGLWRAGVGVGVGQAVVAQPVAGQHGERKEPLRGVVVADPQPPQPANQAIVRSAFQRSRPSLVDESIPQRAMRTLIPRRVR